MKITAAVARRLAADAGVPPELKVVFPGWELSPDSDIAGWAVSLPSDSVAYLEYDAYPGFRFHEVLRDLVGYHCRDLAEVEERREQAMAVLGFVANAGQFDEIRTFLQGEIERLRSSTLEDFDAEFEAQRYPLRRTDLSALFAPHGLRCWFEPVHFEPRGHVFVGKGSKREAEATAPNARYHDVPYPEFVHAGLHPERIATMARAFGLAPPPPERCRVLELGCGVGLTVLNTALDLRSSTFVGVDFSQIQIDQAKATAEQLGLDNVEFLAMDIADFDDSRGKFDYIVAHGMYSWVPEPVRERMLAICRDHLQPNGIAYFSFNAKPGYRLPGILRDLALDDAGDRLQDMEQATATFNRIQALSADPLPESRRPIMKTILQHFSHSNPQSAIYDELADVNNPFLFSEFTAEVQRFGLQYFAEAGIRSWSAKSLSPGAQQLLDGLLEDPVRRMQYRDFLCLSRFHASLLCRDSSKPSYAPLPGIMDQFLYSLRGKPCSANPDVRGEKTETFEGPGGVEVNIGDPLLKAALVTLYLEHPKRYSFDKLVAESSELAAVPADAEKLRRWLLPLWETGFLDLHSRMPAVATEISEKPVAHGLARLHAAKRRSVPSLLGSSAEVDDETDCALLQLLDGSRDWEDLERELGLNDDELQSRLKALSRLGLLVA